MDDALLVRRLERVGDLCRDRQRLGERHCTTRDVRGKIFALDQFHDERGEVGGLLESVDRGDVWMIERGEHFGFALKSREPIGIASDGGGEHFDRHRPFQMAVGRAIHFAHAAGADGGDDFVRAETCAWGESQGWRDYTGGNRQPPAASARPSIHRTLQRERTARVLIAALVRQS